MKKMFALIALVVLIGSNICGYSLMNARADEPSKDAAEKYYTSIQIEKGDSLWSIANRYSKDSDLSTAEYIKELKNMNGLKEDVIHHGQFLTVMYFAP